MSEAWEVKPVSAFLSGTKHRSKQMNAKSHTVSWRAALFSACPTRHQTFRSARRARVHRQTARRLNNSIKGIHTPAALALRLQPEGETNRTMTIKYFSKKKSPRDGVPCPVPPRGSSHQCSGHNEPAPLMITQRCFTGSNNDNCILGKDDQLTGDVWAQLTVPPLCWQQSSLIAGVRKISPARLL